MVSEYFAEICKNNDSVILVFRLNIYAYFGIFSEYFRNIHAYFRNIHAYFRNIHAYSEGIFRNILKIFRNILKIFQNILKIFRNIPKYADMITSITESLFCNTSNHSNHLCIFLNILHILEKYARNSFLVMKNGPEATRTPRLSI